MTSSLLTHSTMCFTVRWIILSLLASSWSVSWMDRGSDSLFRRTSSTTNLSVCFQPEYKWSSPPRLSSLIVTEDESKLEVTPRNTHTTCLPSVFRHSILKIRTTTDNQRGLTIFITRYGIVMCQIFRTKV